MFYFSLRNFNKNYSVKLSLQNKKKIMLAVIDGNEEIETITISNILRRAENEVVLSKVRYDFDNDKTLQQNLIIADSYLDDEVHEKFDMIILPGGKLGAENYNKSNLIINILKSRISSNQMYGAICATPALFLAKNNLLFKESTGYPIFEKDITNAGYKYSNQPYLIDQNCITGRGPGDAIIYALKLVELLNGKEKLEEVKKSLLINYNI